jgi:hypothetical protein
LLQRFLIVDSETGMASQLRPELVDNHGRLFYQ